MLDCEDFCNFIQQKGIEFSTGIPDSILKDLCSYLIDHTNHVINSNEGSCIGLAVGYHLATGKIPLVYLQNSGFGNIINPLTSLADKEIYSIPMLIVIGYRGNPNNNDEPQHVKMGRINENLIKSMEYKYDILSSDFGEVKNQLNFAFDFMENENSPYILLVNKNTFNSYKLKNTYKDKNDIKREKAIEILFEYIEYDDIVIATTGKTSREVFEIRSKNGDPHYRDFLTVGSMGHSSQIALGIAINKSKRRVICLDGDGAFLMHMGGTAIIGDLSPPNFKHVLINNGSHESVGGQPTVGFRIDFGTIAKACNYKNIYKCKTYNEIKMHLPDFLNKNGPSLFEIIVAKGSREDLGRPTIKPLDNKNNFMKNILNN